MGGSQSKRDENFQRNQWEEVRDPQLMNSGQGQYTVVRNRITGLLLDRYSLQFPNEQQYRKYLDSISYRRNQPNIVRVVHYQPNVVKQFCGATYLLNVYLEHTRSRLSQYEDIPYPDYLYCAMAMLDGYKKLYNKIGRFQVNQQQIMIDSEGELRVWLNSDFSQNQAQDFRNQMLDPNGAYEQQYQMVQDVMRIIFENSDEAEGPRLKLRDFYQREKVNYNNKIGFQQAKNIILEYSRINNVQIPHIFKSVYQIYQSEHNFNRQDNLSFKNQLINQSNLSSHQDQQIPVNSSNNLPTFQPVQSIVNPIQNVVNPAQSVANSIPINFQSSTAVNLPNNSLSLRMPNINPVPLTISNRTQPPPLLNLQRQSPSRILPQPQFQQTSVRSQHQHLSRTPPMIRPINQISSPSRLAATPPPRTQFFQQNLVSQNTLPSQRITSPRNNFISQRSTPFPQKPINITPRNQINKNNQVFAGPSPLKTVNTIPKSIPALGQIQVKSNTGPGLVSSNLGHMAGTRLPPNLNGNNQVHLYNSQPLHPTQIAKNQVLNKKTVEITRNPEQITPTPTFTNNQLLYKKNEQIFNKYQDQNSELGNQQRQIQKNLILKDNLENQEEVNEQKIFHDLNNIHQMQIQQKQKGSYPQQQVYHNNLDESSNQQGFYHHQQQNQGQKGYNHHLQNNQYQDNQNTQKQPNNHEVIEQNTNLNNYNQNNFQSVNMGSQQAFVSQGIYQQANLPQGAYKNTTIQGQVQVQNQGQMYNQGQVFNQRQQLTHQLSMNNNNLPQNYQGTNQQLNYYSSLQLGQSNVMNQLNQLNQATHTNIKGQINQMKEANFGSFGNQLQKINTTSSSSYNQTYHGSSGANNLNMQIYENGTNRQNYKKQIYYTLASQVQLDPEIAADMAMLIKS